MITKNREKILEKINKINLFIANYYGNGDKYELSPDRVEDNTILIREILLDMVEIIYDKKN